MIVNEVFEICPKFGLTIAPDYAVDIVEVANGVEYRNQLWSNARRIATITVGPGPELNVETQYVINWFHAMAGKTLGFLVTDATDYKSCSTEETATALDQPLVLITGSTYQLTKRYPVGSAYSDRDINRPKSPIMVADNGTLKTENTHYTVDYETGVVTLSFSPVGTLTWGGEFYLPVRFDTDLPVEVMELRLQTVSFTLREIRNEVETT